MASRYSTLIVTLMEELHHFLKLREPFHFFLIQSCDFVMVRKIFFFFFFLYASVCIVSYVKLIFAYHLNG